MKAFLTALVASTFLINLPANAQDDPAAIVNRLGTHLSLNPS